MRYAVQDGGDPVYTVSRPRLHGAMVTTACVFPHVLCGPPQVGVTRCFAVCFRPDPIYTVKRHLQLAFCARGRERQPDVLGYACVFVALPAFTRRRSPNRIPNPNPPTIQPGQPCGPPGLLAVPYTTRVSDRRVATTPSYPNLVRMVK